MSLGADMKRREFLGVLGGAAVTWPLTARAQKSPILIGFMAAGAANSANSAAQLEAISQGLLENGLRPGRDYLLEARFAAGDYRRFPDMARELAEAGVRIILVATIASARAAQNVTPPVPVVMLAINDPVGSGLVASLARPGGVTTGMATLNQDLTPKMLEIQREIIPTCKIMAALFNPANPSNPLYVERLRATAGESGITVMPVELASPEALGGAFDSIAARRPDALQIVADAGTVDLLDRIVALALAQKLPSFATMPEIAGFGGLAGYGPSQRQLFRRACYFVKRILEGANPGDLPVEQPTRLDLVINLKSAKTLGLEVSPSLLARADEVIE
jgi:putative tryptophan/tyrosine transport system substrate-binding protein